MPIFYTQSQVPRSFEYQNRTNQNQPLELKGTSKKVDATTSSLGSWDRLMEKTFSNAPPKHQQSSLPDSKRTLIPDANLQKENDRVESIKVGQEDTSDHPGSMLSLFNRTGDENEKYNVMRKNKKFTVSKESDNFEDPKRTTKYHPLKHDYDYSSQIATLPITNSIREEAKNPDERKAPLDYKQKYDYTSSIHTLPGYRNDRVDDKSPIKKNKEELGKRFVLTTEEALELKGDLSKQTSPKVSYKNNLSGSDQNVKNRIFLKSKTDKQINPLSKPMKVAEGHQQLLEKSKDEYFCLRVSQSLGKQPQNHQKKRPPSSRDLFKSNFELC